jgi:two-component system, OmpR family, copper resistance phosphate regulon response regulator CusR
MLTILLCEDEPKLSAAMRNELEREGYAVQQAFEGGIAERLFYETPFDLVLLDINFPGKNGWELCRLFRAHNAQVPIIMVTAFGEIEDKIDAFDAGADDYLVKPFHNRELIARIKALTKRSAQQPVPEEVLHIGDLTIFIDEKRVTRADTVINLTAKEYALLVTLAQAHGRVLSRQQLVDRVWGMDFDTGTNTVEVYISFLRAKIDKHFTTKLIHTKVGFGYFLSNE